MSNVFLRSAIGAARNILLGTAVALFVAGSAGVALANGGGGSVPELSPGAIGGALTLLSGALLLVRERLRTTR